MNKPNPDKPEPNRTRINADERTLYRKINRGEFDDRVKWVDDG